MKRQTYYIAGIGLVVGLALTLAYILYPFFQEDGYRKSLETGFSAILGRPVSLEGPISFTFSLHPHLILENIHVANVPSDSPADFFRAARLEIEVSLAPLFQRRLRVEKFLLDEGHLLLEESADGRKNWASQKEKGSSIWSQATPDFFIDIQKPEALVIKDLRISYRSDRSEASHEIAIQHASIGAITERLRKFAVEGHWENVPFMLDLTGGRLADVFDLKEAWPIDGSLSTNGVTALMKGFLGGKDSEEISSLHIQIKGDRLSALNNILKANLADSAPFMVAADLLQKRQAIDLNNIQAKLGSSNITGQLTVHNQDTRPKLVGSLAANLIQVNDFLLSPKATRQGVVPPHPTSSTAELLFPVDANVDVTIHKWQLGEIELGSGALTFDIGERRLQVTSIRAKSFGGLLKANLDIDLKHSSPQTKFTGHFSSLNFGQALQAFGVTEGLTGSTDLGMRVFGTGTNLQDFLKTLTVSLRTDRTTWGNSDPIPDHRQRITLQQGSLTVANGGPMTLTIKGVFNNMGFKSTLLGPSPLDLLTQDTIRPVSLTAQMRHARLTVKGEMNTALPEEGGTFTVSLQGRRLDELGETFPPVGPYSFQAQVTKKGPRYLVNSLESRIGSSDLSGTLEIDTRNTIPHLSGNLTANLINFKELSRPGESDTSLGTLETINGDLKLAIQQAKFDAVELHGLVVDASLQAGRLNVKDVHGTVLDKKSSYGDFNGVFELNTTKAIPSVSGHLALKDIRYERLLPNVRFVNIQEHVMNLYARFSSTGTTLPTMLNKSTVMIEGENLQVQFIRETDQSTPMQLSSDIQVTSIKGGPLHIYAEGNFATTPFRIRSSAGLMGDLLNQSGLWPVYVGIDVPQARLEANGHIQLPLPSKGFTLQVLVNADNLRNLDFLTTSDMPDAYSLHLGGLVTKSPVGYHVTDLDIGLGGTAIKGHVTVMTNRIRPRVMGALSAEKILLGTVKPLPEDSPAQESPSLLKTLTAPVISLGSIVVDTVKNTTGNRQPFRDGETRVLPDLGFPVDSLKLFDLSIESEIKDLRTETHAIGHLKFRTTLEEGLLRLQPVTGRLWDGEVAGSLTLDAQPYVPTLEMNLNLRGLDYGDLTKTFGHTDFIKGRSQSILLALKGRGDTLNEMLDRANGKFEWVNGPLELSTKYLDLWAADFITTAFSMALKPEPVSMLNCSVGYFDIDEGQMKTESILIDTTRLTIAGVGTLNLANERMDVILTPRPKDPSLISLAHTVRFTGLLSDPEVTRNKFRIAESEGWKLLGLRSPIEWVLTIPQISGTTVGTMNQNPCLDALKGRSHTAQALEDVKDGWWGKIKNTFSNIIGPSEPSPDILQ